LAGNLLIFEGRQAINAYAEFLKQSPKILWGTRTVLLVSVWAHIVATVQLTRRNRLSRPIKYIEHEPVSSNVASRVMIWSGVFLGLYIVYHLLHFTVGYAHPHFIV